MGAQLTSLLGRPGALAIVAALGLYAAARSRRKARARRRKKEERGGAAVRADAAPLRFIFKKKPDLCCDLGFDLILPHGASGEK